MGLTKVELPDLIKEYPDFPRPGILFRDMSPLLRDAVAFDSAIRQLAEQVLLPDVVAGIESRGFIIGAALAKYWGTGFAPIRKPGKLPGHTIVENYALEYGQDSLMIQVDSLKPDQRVVVVDDLLATGGTASAAARLIERLGGQVTALLFLIELENLKGRDQLSKWDVHSLIQYK